MRGPCPARLPGRPRGASQCARPHPDKCRAPCAARRRVLRRRPLSLAARPHVSRTAKASKAFTASSTIHFVGSKSTGCQYVLKSPSIILLASPGPWGRHGCDNKLIPAQNLRPCVLARMLTTCALACECACISHANILGMSRGPSIWGVFSRGRSRGPPWPKELGSFKSRPGNGKQGMSFGT